MGHKRLGYLPKSQSWRSIVDEMGAFALGTSDISTITQNTLKNVEGRFSDLRNDPSIQSSFEFLLHLSLAFQKENPTQYLSENNIIEGGELSLLKIARAATNYKAADVESYEYQSIAKQASVDAINNWYKNNIEKGRSLFSEQVNTESIFNRASDGRGFCELARLYFSKLTERYLRYFLEREASTKISDVRNRERFSREIEKHINQISKHAFETAKIMQSYSAGWHNKNVKESLPEEREIKNFLSYALGKIKSELIREEIN